jgi:DNA (cytosine-5)-methyltransferase 1
MRPRLLDLFCGAGGAAMGYHQAGFDIVGVDNRPQPHYPFEFRQADALAYPLDGYDAIHASPPCQAYSVAANIWVGRLPPRHPDLVGIVRERLCASGVPYVIENVPGAPLRNPVTICGLSLGLNVRRHRNFECSFPAMVNPCTGHDRDYVIVFGGGARGRARTAKGGPIIPRATVPVADARTAMGIDWMTRDELSQAIPPAYTQHIGRYLLNAIRHRAASVWKPIPVAFERNRSRH